MKKKFVAVILAAVMAAALTGCGGGLRAYLTDEVAGSDKAVSQPAVDAETMRLRQEEFAGFLASVRENRRSIYNGEQLDFPDSWAESPTDRFTDEEIAALAEPPAESLSQLTAEEAAEDIETLFRMLRQGYAAYDYFGGETAFSAAEERLLRRYADGGTAEELAEGIISELRAFVIDNQLSVGGIPAVAEQRRSYYVPGLFLESAEGTHPALVKRSIDADGKLCFVLAASCTEAEAASLPQSVTVNGQETAVTWAAMAEDIGEKLAVSAAEWEDGTALLTSRTFAVYDEEASARLDALSRLGGDYRSEPVLVWDLRSNRGGSDGYFRDWFAGFAGNKAQVKVSYAAKVTELNKNLLNLILTPAWYTDASAGEMREIRSLLFAVQDDFTASSGESALAQLRTLTGTVTVGSATRGALLTGNTVCAYLPHSGLEVCWGSKLQQIEQNRNPDGCGWEPDLWVPSGEVLERVEKMIGYYGLSGI